MRGAGGERGQMNGSAPNVVIERLAKSKEMSRICRICRISKSSGLVCGKWLCAVRGFQPHTDEMVQLKSVHQKCSH